jgi:hypothetical protein
MKEPACTPANYFSAANGVIDLARERFTNAVYVDKVVKGFRPADIVPTVNHIRPY